MRASALVGLVVLFAAALVPGAAFADDCTGEAQAYLDAVAVRDVVCEPGPSMSCDFANWTVWNTGNDLMDCLAGQPPPI